MFESCASHVIQPCPWLSPSQDACDLALWLGFSALSRTLLPVPSPCGACAIFCCSTVVPKISESECHAVFSASQVSCPQIAPALGLHRQSLLLVVPAIAPAVLALRRCCCRKDRGRCCRWYARCLKCALSNRRRWSEVEGSLPVSSVPDTPQEAHCPFAYGAPCVKGCGRYCCRGAPAQGRVRKTFVLDQGRGRDEESQGPKLHRHGAHCEQHCSTPCIHDCAVHMLLPVCSHMCWSTRGCRISRHLHGLTAGTTSLGDFQLHSFFRPIITHCKTWYRHTTTTNGEQLLRPVIYDLRSS